MLARDSLTAYRWPDGARRWTTATGTTTRMVGVEDGRVVLAEQQPAALIGLDATTGARQWRRAGLTPAVYGSGGAPGVVVATTDAATVEADTGVDIRTGAVRWSLPRSPGIARSLVPAGRGSGIAIADLGPDGTLLVHSAESAAAVRTVRLDHPGAFNWFGVRGDRLTLAQTTERNEMLSSAVYDLATGRMLWQRNDGPGGAPLWWCGPMMCTGTRDEIAVLDPDTGRERWRHNRLGSLGSPDDRYLLAAPLVHTGPEIEPGIVVLDPATGHVLRRVPDWYVTGALGRHGVLVATRLADGAALLGAFDPGTGAVRVLARAEHWTTVPCTVSGSRLACFLDPVAVWPVPPILSP
nr:hypothetical protein GCM10020063_048880 [Dactylosporangium thailandense]